MEQWVTCLWGISASGQSANYLPESVTFSPLQTCVKYFTCIIYLTGKQPYEVSAILCPFDNQESEIQR